MSKYKPSLTKIGIFDVWILFLHSCIICLFYFDRSQMNGGRGAFDVEEHKNGKRKQITDGIKERKKPQFCVGLGNS